MTILIKNIQLLDGTGRPAVKADVLVKKEKIYAIGSFPKYKADEIIDGMGAYLSPGFIDINTDSDHYLTLFSNPSQKDFLLQGVTTIIGGHCGASLAPLLYGSLESIRPWASPDRTNINWQTIAEFLKTMEQRPLGVNFGTLVGHYTIRQSLIGNAFRKLTRNEIAVFKFLLARSLKEGAFGFSTGLGYSQSQQVPYGEIKLLVETVSKFKCLYATHLRNEREGLLDSINETIKIAKETGVRTLVSHFRPINGFQNDYETSLELINKNIAKADICFDVSPSDSSDVPVVILLPSWIQNSDKKIMLKNFQTPNIREKILKELPKLNGRKIIITSAPGNEYLEGKSLEEFSANRNLDVKNGLLTLMEITNFQAVVFYGNIDIKIVKKALFHKRAIIASNSAGRSTAFSKFLKLSEKEKIFPIEKAIYKITGLPAQRLGLEDRGTIKDGNFADLVVFRDAEIRNVILNGKIVVKDGEFQNVLAGKILRKK
ncbi:MAG: amidohydrolase family protein [Patescibacteria group bacterium]